MAARYWRVISFEMYDAPDLELSELQLYGGASRIDGSATLSSSVAPVSGSLADLHDGGASVTRFDGANVPSFFIKYDFGSSVDVTGIRLGAGNSKARYPKMLTLQYSADDVTWTTLANVGQWPYPGDLTLTVVPSNTLPSTGTDMLPLQLMTREIEGVRRFARSDITGSTVAGPVISVPAFRDMEFGGKGRIAGTLKIHGTPNTPVQRKVRLVRDRDGLLVRETYSNATTGAYSFDYIDERVRYTVLAYDNLNDFRAVVADNVAPEVI